MKSKRRRNLAPHSFQTFVVSILLVILVLFLGTVGFYYIERMTADVTQQPQTIWDALYFAIITLSTTGYGDMIPHSETSKIFVTVFLVVGIITLTWAGANVIAFVVEGHLTEAVRLRKMEKTIDSLKGHYIICGCGRVGKEVVKEFRSNPLDYVVIDKNKEILEECLDENELWVTGDTTQDEVLEEANIKQAKGLIACCPSDAQNVFTILTAKGLNPDLFVISRGQEESSRTKLIQAGADRIVMPSHLGGVRLAAMALRPEIVDFLDQTFRVSEKEEPILLEEVPVEKGNPFIGKKLMDTHIKSQTEVM
ncbi:potassium channel protein, partial [bacterium]|nr:potassium channel protein [bacterium]